ncbi:VOC family protein [Terasakiella sp.]|uniref:VOC family protein n=1 Tax=unclassified Terasakiella TaxID=2614952 RepID=UPI003AA84911
MTLCPPKDKTINYIEFLVQDISQSKKFYGDVFGWTFTDYGPDYCEFNDGHMTGGFAHGTPVSGGPLVVLYGSDLNAMQEAVTAAGGEISKEIFDFPGGRRFQFKDLDGYELAVWSET